MDSVQAYRARVAEAQREARAARSDPARWPFRQAACVLSRFVPASLHPYDEDLPAHSHLGWDDFFEDCEPVAVGSGEWWQLREEVRREALRRLRTRQRMQAALAANPERPDDELQRMLDEAIAGQLHRGLSTLSRAELSALVTVREWLGTILDGLPGEAELRRALVTCETLAPMQRLAGGDSFVGRAEELGKLREYVGVIESPSLGSRARQFVRQTYYDLTSRPPLLITGPGGIGKSSLIARFILDHSENFQSPDALPFVYLDLDRDHLIPSQPLTLVAEAALQLTTQWPNLEPLLLRVIEQIRPLIGTKESVAESVFEGTRALTGREASLFAFGEALKMGSRERPVLFVIDTFEEAQYLGFDVVRGLGSLLMQLQRAAPMMRIVLVGRADLDDQTSVLPTTTIRLSDLSYEEARELLRRHLKADPPPDASLLDEVIELVGRHPMSLKLASTVLKQRGLAELRSVETRGPLLLRVKAETVQARLYGRILAHVHDPDVKKLAKPGLVVRRITEDVIRDVLAEPCGIPIDDPAKPRALLDELATEVSLVFRAEDGSLRHRPDVRRVMLKDLTADVPYETIRAIHDRAIAFYEKQSDAVARAEEIYHRLMRGDSPSLLDERWIDGLDQYLRTAIEEVPPTERIWLSRRLRITPDRGLIALADLEDWEEVTANTAQRLIGTGEPGRAIDAMRARSERSNTSPLFHLESEALRLVGNWTAAREIAAQGIAASARAGVPAQQRHLLVQLALVEETAGRLDAALEAVRSAIQVPGDRLEAVERLRLTITEIRLLRKLGSSRDEERHAAIDRAKTLLTADTRDSLEQRPALLRETAAEIGMVDAGILGDALEVLGVEVVTDTDADRFARALANWDDSLRTGSGVSDLARRAGFGASRSYSWRTLVSPGAGRELSAKIVNWRAELRPHRDVEKVLVEFYRAAVDAALQPRRAGDSAPIPAIASVAPAVNENPAYPPELEDAEARLIAERRASARPTPPEESPPGPRKLPDDAIGFGLSGGGIRSATFSLGILQALARVERLRDIDFLSTVSGGGYIGAFLGRLFTREWIRNPEDVERVLLSQDPAGAPPGLGARVCRWLRDNGRYLAPRGSGDLLLLGSIALRNWLAVQVVLVTFALSLFLLLHIVRGGLDGLLARTPLAATVTAFLTCAMPGGDSILWWSPWLFVVALVVSLWVVPAGWAYFLVGRDRTGPRGLHPIFGAAFVLAIATAGAIYYFREGALQARDERLGRFVICAIVGGLGALALGWLEAGRWRARRDKDGDRDGITRNVLSRWLTIGLVTAAVLLAWTLVDTVAQTIYAVAIDKHLGQWFSAVVAALAVAGAFARQIATLVGSRRGGARPGVTFSTVTWIAATVVVSAWLVLVTVGSYAVVWRFDAMGGRPEKLGAQVQPTILGTSRLVVTPGENGKYEIAPAAADISVCTPPVAATGTEQRAPQPNWGYVAATFFVLLLLSFLFGQTRAFANMSSLHAFYAARLTRTFLGASNGRRHEESKPVTETIPGDDLSGDSYWRWPIDQAEGGLSNAPSVYPWTRGGPLHLVNVTVNETLDAVTGVQHADRKGTGMAIGPAGLSLGVRHHLTTSRPSAIVRPLHGGYQAFARGARFPEPLPLGRWMSISGAAFSAAAGSHTTVPSAILAGMFNVRLGYWWDSGTARKRRSSFAFAFPVQYALLSEMLARTRGTADSLWNLSDGGHFENMGGYELIRRRLPIIVIVDAEADPDYVFAGLSDLVRKARLDFNAEVVFYNNRELYKDLPAGAQAPLLPPALRAYFGDLDALRRGRWSGEPVPPVGEKEEKRYSLEVNRTRVSRAHAALARVEYLDNGDTSWLVYVKATLMGDEPEDVCHYHRAHPEFPQEPTTDQFFDEAQWESYRRLGQHIGHRMLTPELFDHLRTFKPVAGSELVNPDGFAY